MCNIEQEYDLKIAELKRKKKLAVEKELIKMGRYISKEFNVKTLKDLKELKLKSDTTLVENDFKNEDVSSSQADEKTTNFVDDFSSENFNNNNSYI